MIKKQTVITGLKPRGFTFTEVMITMSLFMVMASVGVGAYFKYYSFSLITNDYNQIVKILHETRFKAMKNPYNSDYGVHLSPAANQFVSFRDSYVPGAQENIVVQMEHLDITDLNLMPNQGVTNDIIFENLTGKTENHGSFTVEKDEYTHTISINPQGVFE